MFLVELFYDKQFIQHGKLYDEKYTLSFKNVA